MAKIPKDILDYFARQGKRGGKKSAESMTPERRAERAKKAAEARWGTKAKKKAK